jgi:gluconate 2-dehydrogenase gamma chain
MTTPDENRPGAVTRRKLLGRAGVAAATAGLGSALAGCGTQAGQPPQAAVDVNAPGIPGLPASMVPMCGVYNFFSRAEARTVEAFAMRLVPGDERDPGAREACVVTYIDHKLARFETFATPTYFHAPFAKPTAGHPGPQSGATETILVHEQDLPLYGFQSNLTPQEAYRKGIVELDDHARAMFGKPFADLGEAAQDEIITALEKDAVATFTAPGGKDFFTMLQEDTVEGMFADPLYGGNRDYAGWKLIGYPGAQRAYTGEELRHGPHLRRVQGLREMAPMHPGEPQDHVVLPISGTRRTAGG